MKSITYTGKNIKNQRNIKSTSYSQAIWREKYNKSKGKFKMIDINIFEEIRFLRQNGNTLQYIKDFIYIKYGIKRSIEMIRRYCLDMEIEKFVDFDKNMKGNKQGNKVSLKHPWRLSFR